MEDSRKEILKELKRQNAGAKPKLSSRTAHSFNLAACVLPVIYNAFYGRYGLVFLFLMLTAIPHITDRFVSAETYHNIAIYVFVLTILLALLSGITGNTAAYNARDYRDEEEFLNAQKGWIPAIIIAIVVHCAILPIQQNGHFNTERMIALADAKQELQYAIKRFSKYGFELGQNIVGNNIPILFAEYIGEHSSDYSKIKSKSGYTYKIIGYDQECGKRKETTYHEQKTACGKAYIDVNGDKAPNLAASKENADGVKELRHNANRLNDTFVLYIYSDDLAPKEGSVEEYAFRKFERK